MSPRRRAILGCARDEDASPFLRKSLAAISSQITGPVADIACGFGRNALYLARRGFEVYCIDNNLTALRSIAGNSVSPGKLIPIAFDLENEALSFEPGYLGAAVCVHSWGYRWCGNLIGVLAPLIKTRGIILIETIGTRGGNYRELPRAGYIASKMKSAFEISTYIERKAGPPGHDSVTVKAVGVKL